MKELWANLKFWVSDTFHSRGRAVRQSSSLAKTIREASHVRGGSGGVGGLSRSASEEALKHAAEGHEQYDKSFKKKGE